MKKILLLAILLITSLFFVLYNYEKSKDKDKVISSLTKNCNNIKNVYEELLIRQLQNWQLNGKILDNIEVQDELTVKHKIYDLKKLPAILFYFDSEMCQICVEKEFHNFQQLVNHYGIKKTIIIATGYQPQYIYNSQIFKPWIHNIYIAPKGCQINYFATSPLIAYIDKNGIFVSSYHSSMNTNDAFSNFFEYLKTKEL